jgi:hypothetical protein
MTTRTLNPNPRAPYRAVTRRPQPAAPLLTIERAIADELCPTSLRQVAAANDKLARKEGDARLHRQAANLTRVAEKLELLGFGRGAGGVRKEAA